MTVELFRRKPAIEIADPDATPPNQRSLPAADAAGGEAVSRSAPGRWRRWLAEPILHFVLLGLALVAVSTVYQRATVGRRIVVTPERVAWLAQGYAAQFGRQPDPATVEALVNQDVRDEVLFRHGKELGLDRDDEIVRRRLIQKSEFLVQGLAQVAQPSDDQLRAYFAAHAQRYAQPAKATFTHIFFAANGDPKAAQAHARAVLARLTPATARAPERGDPFPDLYDYANYDRDQVDRLFGDAAFASALFAAPVGAWVGPVHSSYGYHLLRVASIAPARPARFEDVRDAVLKDDIDEQQQAGDKGAYDRVAASFTVVRRDRVR